VARKLPRLRRVLGAQAIASVAYGEIGSSLYIALGVVALYAAALTPWVLLAVGLLFVLVAVSYAEGATSLRETGGAAMFVRRAFNDPLGFMTGWVLLLDYVVLIALAGLFVPHYLAAVGGWDTLGRSPWDGLIGIASIAAVAAIRLVRRVSVYRAAAVVAALALVAQAALIVLGLVYVFHAGDLGDVDLGSRPAWDDLAFALALGALAYTGLETVANFASETVKPGRTLPRSLFGAIGAVVVTTVAVAVVSVSVPAVAEEWRRAPLAGIAAAFDGPAPTLLADVVRVGVSVSGVVVLLATITTSISGVGRLTSSLGRHEMLPHAFARVSRRTVIAPVSIVAAALAAVALLLAAIVHGESVLFLASLYSFGILLAFTAAQLAVLRLRRTQPELRRPYRAPLGIRVRGASLPLPALVGAPLTFALWIAALLTHDAARVGGPAWLLGGVVVYVLVRRSRGQALAERVRPAKADLVPAVEGAYERILVPVKLGPIGEEVLATAIKLAEERGSTVDALHVVRVPLALPLDADLGDEEELAKASIADAKLLASEHDVTVEGRLVRARSIGEAIVEEAKRQGSDLVVLGSSPRWRRQSRFFSPTVDYVLRNAPAEVMVVAFPQGVLDEDVTRVEA
jgi:basic amino acid/polyamine antiporter, APA family